MKTKMWLTGAKVSSDEVAITFGLHLKITKTFTLTIGFKNS